MNLQENIQRILREEVNELNANTDNKVILQLNKHIDTNINDIKSKLPEQKINIIDTNEIINGMSQYLKSNISATLMSIKSGKGGDTFVYNVYHKLLDLIEVQLKNIGWAKKKSIWAFAPSKEELKKTLDQSEEFYDYIQMFEELVDFPFFIGWMDETDSYKTKLWLFDDQINKWLKTNKQTVKSQIITKMLNFIYT